MRPERTATAKISCASWVPTSDFFFPIIIRSICLCREIKKCAVWQKSDKVLETDGFRVCDAAQSFLDFGKGRQVLYSTSNKRSTFLSYERLQRSFLVLEATLVPAQEKHHLSFWSPCVCQTSSTSTIHLLPNDSKVQRFRSDSLSSMYALCDSSFTRRRCFAASSTTSTQH